VRERGELAFATEERRECARMTVLRLQVDTSSSMNDLQIVKQATTVSLTT